MPRILLSRRWLFRHAIVAFLLVGFAAATWWQAVRAGDGNLRSYAYAVEWPIFGVFVIYVWWKTIKDELSADPDASKPEAPRQRERPEIDDSGDPELMAYNRYLAELNSEDA